MLFMLKDKIGKHFIYACPFLYFTVAIVYALYCFLMGFIAFWTRLINLLTISNIVLVYKPTVGLLSAPIYSLSF